MTLMTTSCSLNSNMHLKEGEWVRSFGTVDTFRAPYAEEFFTAAHPDSSSLPWPSSRYLTASPPALLGAQLSGIGSGARRAVGDVDSSQVSVRVLKGVTSVQHTPVVPDKNVVAPVTDDQVPFGERLLPP